MKIALSTDHAGLDSLQALKVYLTEKGHECIDFGPKTFDAADDYPDFIRPAAQAVASGECEVGIIMGGSGQGEAIVANRFKGVRCALFYGGVKPSVAIDSSGTMAIDEYEILRLSREHNNANMLSLAGRFLSSSEVQKAAQIWLDTSFTGIERHARRVAKIDEPA